MIRLPAIVYIDEPNAVNMARALPQLPLVAFSPNLSRSHLN
jgi:hypothetical protein